MIDYVKPALANSPTVRQTSAPPPACIEMLKYRSSRYRHWMTNN